MDLRTVITILLCTVGGLATNLIYTFVFKFLFTEIYENTLRTHGLRGLKFRMAIAILLINLPGMLHGLFIPSFSKDELILSGICAASAFFALLMLVRNLPKSSSKQLQN